MLEVRGLVAGYAMAPVLRGVDLMVPDTGSVALLGRNGMGKTTLLRAICGLRPPVIAAGTVTLRDVSLLGLRPDEVAHRGVALVPQGRRVFPSLSVRENLAIARLPAPADVGAQAWDMARVFELFPRLAERARQLAGTLSGGEQQMLAIARALMMQPRVLVMDEPSEGLAPAILEQLVDQVRRIRAGGQALLIAEQNVDLALDMATEVAILGDEGLVAWSGSSAALRDQPQVVAELVGLATRHGGIWT
jgi:branched-chain amino acid transport system ATP-binding protein